jgi:hypothetical protein
MAERYQARGLRIWDSKTDTYSDLFANNANADYVARYENLTDWTFKPLAEWQDDEPEGDPVEQSANDPVNNPAHYQGKVECIDAIEAALGAQGFIAYCRGNIIKYTYRAGRKGDSAEDLRKAVWYLERAIETLEK